MSEAATPSRLRLRPAGLLVLVALGLFALTLAAVLLRQRGGEVAPWWPAAGLAAAAVLRSRAADRTVVLGVIVLATAAANAAAGRPLLLAAALGCVVAAEAAVVAAVVRAGGAAFALTSLRQLTRFVLAVGAGASTAALLGCVVLVVGADADEVQVIAAILPSHASALLLLVPLAASLPASTGDAGRLERVLQAGALAALLAWVFREDQALPVTLLPVPALVWASVRCGVRTVLVEAVGVAVVVIVATLSGWGPFADTAASAVSDPRSTVALVQTYLVVTWVVTLVPTLALHERALALRQLGALAREDPLTGLPNRRLLLEELERLQARSARTGEPASILTLDLDGFKSVNDTHGHQAGDRVLREVAGRLASQARADDVLGRVGGDEFLLLCPGLAPGTAALTTLVDRLRHTTAEPLRTLPGVRLGVSVGTAAVVAGAPAGENLHSADAAMYADKARRHELGGAGRPPRPRSPGRSSAG